MTPHVNLEDGPRKRRASWDSDEAAVGVDVVGLRLFSGTGEWLGVVTGVQDDRWGRPKHLAFVERDGGEPRRVPLRVVRRVESDGIHLAGPREGYHITRLDA